VTLTLLAPATAIVFALGAFALSMRSLEAEVVALRASLRASRAAAVATDDLERHTRVFAGRAAEIDHNVRARAELRRSRRRSARR